MARHSMFKVLAPLGFFCALLHDAKAWEVKDMNPLDLRKPTGELEVPCGAADCTLKIYYFKGKNFDSHRKNILNIPGGPGTIVDPAHRGFPQKFEPDYNVYYLYVRGNGPSIVGIDKDNDKLLRAKYVADDIEALRRKELGGKSWDAIYAHSWGTIVAQLYAKNHGKVAKLVLSGSVSRRENYELNRIAMLRRNLETIYENYSRSVCSLTNLNSRRAAGAIADDFCFLSGDQRSMITKRLTEMLKEFQSSYGSVGFVTRYFKELKRDEKEFREKFPYPEEFFLALGGLGNFGAINFGAKETMGKEFSFKGDQINSALVIGYYLSLKKEDLAAGEEKPCETAPFFNRIRGAAHQLYCNAFNEAKDNFGERGSTTSIRAREVFAVFDGLNRSNFVMLRQVGLLDENQCFSADDVKRFAESQAPNVSTVARELLKKIGTTTAPNEGPVCPWDPGKFKHNVPTLLLKGGADATTAGCQAEDFFNFGLDGQRVLIEFPGQGHLVPPPLALVSEGVPNVPGQGHPRPLPLALRRDGSPNEGQDNYVELIKLFLTKSTAKDFINDQRTKKMMDSLKATKHFGDGSNDHVLCKKIGRIDD